MHTTIPGKTLRSRSMLGMLSVSLTILILVTLILFSWFRIEITAGYQKLVQSTLGHIEAVFSQNLSDARLTLGNWYQSADGKSLCTDPDTVFTNHMTFLNHLRGMLSATSFYQSVSFINTSYENALYIGTNVSFPDQAETSLSKRLQEVQPKNRPFIWIAGKQYSPSETIPYLCLPIADHAYGSAEFTGMAVLTIDLRQLSKSLLANEEMEQFRICILNEDGFVVCHSDPSLIGVNCYNRDWVQKILSGGQRFRMQDGDVRYEFLSSDIRKTGFAIVIQSGYGAQISNINHITNIVILLIVLAGIAQIFLTLAVSRRIFFPFDSLVRSIKQSAAVSGPDPSRTDIPPLDDVALLSRYHQQISAEILQLGRKRDKDFIVKNLLAGVNGNVVVQLFGKHQIITPQIPYYLCMTSAEIPGIPEPTLRDYEQMRGLLSGIIIRVFSACGTCTVFELGLRRMLYMLSADKHEGSMPLEAAVNSADESVRRLSSISVRYLVSGPYTDNGISCVSAFPVMEGTMRTMPVLNRFLIFPESEAQKEFPDSSDILKAVRELNFEHYREAILSWLDSCPCVPYSDFIKNTAALAAEIAYAGKLSAQGIETEFSVFDSREELEEALVGLYHRVQEKPSALGRNTASMMEEAIDCIQQHYDDPSLSVNLLAERLHITPAYFGKLFYSFTGERTLDYILHIRMERAKYLLLTEPDKDIAQIAGMVGYNNAAYFTTAFRKFYGITPSRFREGA